MTAQPFGGGWVVTADDYGLDGGVNEAILELAAADRLDAVSVMAHRDADTTGLDRLRRLDVRLGLHFVATAGRPLGGSGAALSGSGGRLPADWRRLLVRLASRPWLARVLADEAERQLGRLRELGVRPAFFNAHEHVHLLPPVWIALAPVLRRWGIPAVRIAVGQRAGASKQGLVAACSALDLRVADVPGAARLSPLGIDRSGTLTPGEASVLARAAARVRRGGGVPELVVHPAVDRRHGQRGEARQRELELLRSGVLDDRLGRTVARSATGA